MGDPRRLHKKYSTPGHPWQKERIQSELPFMGKYGLRNKKEIWRHKTQIGRYRQLARGLLAAKSEVRSQQENLLIRKLSRLGLVPETASLDDILGLTLDDIMERRLQTLVLRKGLANTIYQARQRITHGHVAVDGKVIRSPSYLVTINEQSKIEYAAGSTVKKGETSKQTSK